MNAKFVVSAQLGLRKPLLMTSKLLMCSEAHQCVRSQLIWVMKGGFPGG